MNLYERLMWTAKKTGIRCICPGTSGRVFFTMANPYAFDVTEIDGTDNLHQPEGEILLGDGADETKVWNERLLSFW